MIRVPQGRLETAEEFFLKFTESYVRPRLRLTLLTIRAKRSGNFSDLESEKTEPDLSSTGKTLFIKSLFRAQFSLNKGKYQSNIQRKQLKFSDAQQDIIITFCEWLLAGSALRDFILTKPESLGNLLNDTNVRPILINELKWFIQAIFNYHILIGDQDENSPFSYELSSRIGIELCPYCNRNYTHTVTRLKGGGKLTRPQFDHFYDKGQNPILAVCFYNLIPSCSTCNHIKRSQPFSVSTHGHPFIEDMGEDVIFNVLETPSESRKYSLVVQSRSILSNNRAARFSRNLQDLGVIDVYTSHKDELDELYRKLRILNKTNIRQIIDILNKDGAQVTEHDMLKYYFGVYLDKDNWGRRPFSKLIYDVISLHSPELLTHK